MCRINGYGLELKDGSLGLSVLTGLDDLISRCFHLTLALISARIGKGQSLVLAKQVFPAEVNGDPGVAPAIDLYDARRANEIRESTGMTTGSTGADSHACRYRHAWSDRHGHRMDGRT
jgi:hypothetical protein